MKLLVTPRAHADAAGAADWYDGRCAGLGDLFIDEVEHTVSRIRRNPESYKRIARHCRRSVLHKFPYVVVYRVRGNAIEIIGVLPTRADPALSAKRIEASSH